MLGWHHRLNGHEFEQAQGDGEGQGGLACCSPWGCRESDVTERLNSDCSCRVTAEAVCHPAWQVLASLDRICPLCVPVPPASAPPWRSLPPELRVHVLFFLLYGPPTVSECLTGHFLILSTLSIKWGRSVFIFL